MISEGLDKALVLEDDVRFEPYFRFKLHAVLDELRRLRVSWDLVYVCRFEKETITKYYLLE